MATRNVYILALAFCVVLISSMSLRAQQSSDQAVSTMAKKVLTPEQKEYQRQWKDYMVKRQSLQARAKQIFDAEMARDKAGDCSDANTTYDFNICFGKQLTLTDENLKSYEKIIRQLQVDPPEFPGQPEAPSTGLAGPVLSGAQLSAEFDEVEQVWVQYRKTACQAAFHQFGGGTGGPSFELQCELQLVRDHMSELDMIYGGDLHR